jgi:hypothetical protein
MVRSLFPNSNARCFRKFVITAARIVVIVAIATFGPNVRGRSTPKRPAPALA